MGVSKQLRRVITSSGQTHYRIGKDIGVDARVIDRFIAGRSLRSDTIDKLCDYFGLELRPQKKRRRAT